jgi:hypothetical protein
MTYVDPMVYVETEEMKASDAGWLVSFEFVERPVKQFDIFTDLKPGDKIRRTCNNGVNGIQKGTVLTFKQYVKGIDILPDKSYIDETYVETEEMKAVDAGWLASFEFLERPVKQFDIFKDMKEKLTYTLTELSDNEYLFTITNQLAFKDMFKDSKGFTIKAHSFPDSNISCNTLYIKGIESHRTSCIIRHDDISVLSAYIDNMKNAIKEYNDSLTKIDIHKEEFIEAMKTTIKEYVDGTHVFNADNCALCKVATKFRPIYPPINCSICPWVVITGHKCRQTPDFKVNERITELLYWIKKYKAM